MDCLLPCVPAVKLAKRHKNNWKILPRLWDLLLTQNAVPRLADRFISWNEDGTKIWIINTTKLRDAISEFSTFTSFMHTLRIRGFRTSRTMIKTSDMTMPIKVRIWEHPCFHFHRREDMYQITSKTTNPALTKRKRNDQE